jgi:hypothetical protein
MSKPKTLSHDEIKKEMLRWLFEPLYWAKKFCGPDFDPWSGQEELWINYGKMLNAKLKRYQAGPQSLTPEESALADKMGISIMSGHGMGKERSVSGIGFHYLHVLSGYRPKGVCTAPAGPTLHSTLWPEFGKVRAGSEYLASLFTHQSDKIYLTEDADKGKFMRMEPRTIQKNSKEEDMGVVLAGIHATGVLYLITEASGVPEAVFKPIEGGLTDPLSIIIMIFNPTKRTGFAAESHTVNRKHWLCMHWDGRDLKKEKLLNPGRFVWFNERAQDALIEKYGADSDTARIRVYGLPPKQSADTLIHYEAAMSAQDKIVESFDNDPLVIFADIGGEGSSATADPSVVSILRGPVLVKQIALQGQDTTQLSDKIAQILKDELASLPVDTQWAVGVDYIGIGRGVYDQLRNVQLVRNLHKVDVSERPLDDRKYHRLRDQVWWEMREGFMELREVVLPNASREGCVMERNELDELIGELTSIKWAEVQGKIKVQGKGNSSGIPNVRPLVNSPNRADSLVGAWWLYKHAVSRIPRARRVRARGAGRGRPVSWKAA